MGSNFLTIVFFFSAWKPSFELVSFGPFYLFKGIQARLPCKPLAEPYPTFRWFKDGVAIEYGKNESYMMDADGSLIILEVGAGDSGKYTCEAQNYLGKTNATADCILLGKDISTFSAFEVYLKMALDSN